MAVEVKVINQGQHLLLSGMRIVLVSMHIKISNESDW